MIILFGALGVKSMILLSLGAISIVFFSLIAGIGPSPTGSKVKRVVVDMLPQHIEGVAYELGCGWGTLLSTLASRFKAIGYELSPIPWLFSWLRVRQAQVIWGDFRKRSLSDAGLVVCYLYPRAMEQLKEQIPKGCVVISHTFAIPDWVPVEVRTADDLYRTKVYRYDA